MLLSEIMLASSDIKPFPPSLGRENIFPLCSSQSKAIGFVEQRQYVKSLMVSQELGFLLGVWDYFWMGLGISVFHWEEQKIKNFAWIRTSWRPCCNSVPQQQSKEAGISQRMLIWSDLKIMAWEFCLLPFCLFTFCNFQPHEELWWASKLA